MPWVARAEDGYELWLRYHAVEAPWLDRYRDAAREIVAADATSPAVAELRRGIDGLVGIRPPVVDRPTRDGAIVIGTPTSSSVVSALHLDLRDLGSEGYLLRAMPVAGRRALVVAANGEAGVLYGSFALLRFLQTRRPLEALNLTSVPRIQHRLLNHWDNLDGTIERGYAGATIWDWQKLPDYLSPRYVDYARACASLGINGTVLTNVNADAVSLTPAYLKKAAALAGVFIGLVLGGLLAPVSWHVKVPMLLAAMVVLPVMLNEPALLTVRATWRAEPGGLAVGPAGMGGLGLPPQE